LAHSGVVAGALTIVLALASEGFRPACMAFVGAATPASQRKQAFALNRLVINLGMSVGPALGGVLIGARPAALFFVDGGSSLAAAIVLASALGGRSSRRRGNSDPTPEASARDTPSAGPAHTDRGYLFFLAATLLIAAVFFQLDAAMPLYVVRDLHVSER